MLAARKAAGASVRPTVWTKADLCAEFCGRGAICHREFLTASVSAFKFVQSFTWL